MSSGRIDTGKIGFSFLMMIQLTEKAAGQVRRLQVVHGVEGHFLRLFVESGGCSGMEYGMSFDGTKEGDHRIETQGVMVLVDRESMSHLKGSEVDFDDGLTGKGFEVRNPNANSTCGCGRSFQ